MYTLASACSLRSVVPITLLAAVNTLAPIPARAASPEWVFAAGGYDDLGGYSADVDFYQVSSQKWFSGGGLIHARIEYGAVHLNDGTILVAGGTVTHTTIEGGISDAEIYSPEKGMSTAVSPMNVGRSGMVCVKLLNGRVLVAGGTDLDGNPLSSGEIYHPATKKWSLVKNSMSAARYQGAAVLLYDGRVLITGGVTSATNFVVSPTADVYDPVQEKFIPVGPMSEGRCFFSLLRLANGEVLASGGANETTGYTSSQDIYNPATRKFSPTVPMLTPRAGLSSSVLSDGKVLLASGGTGTDSQGNPTSTSTAEIFDPIRHTIRFTSHPLTIDRQGAFQITLDNGTVLIGGGGINDGASITSSVELYNPKADTFTALPAAMSATRGLVPVIPLFVKP